MKLIRYNSRFYQRLKTIQNNLFVIQSLQTGCLMGIGDLLAQTGVEKTPILKVDTVRTAKFASLGVFFVGPCLSTWYRILATKVGHKRHAALKKVALDQLVFAPTFLPIFITAVNVMNCKSWEHTKNELKLKYLEILKTNYKVWPAVQLINFGFVPLRYQVLVAQMVAIFWNAYISYKTQAK